MKVQQTELPGVLLVEPDVFDDGRGFFLETYHAERYASAGIAAGFVQDNLSFSTRSVLRGLHLQNPQSQGKLVYVLLGEVFDAAVDLRRGSPYFGRWTAVSLSDRDKRQLYVPQGFAHGFCVLSATALLAYKCTDVYDRDSELTVAWDDPQIAIEWPVERPILSARDAAGLALAEIDPARLPVFAEGGEP